MKLDGLKLAPISPIILKNEVVPMKNEKMAAIFASRSLKYTPLLQVYNVQCLKYLPYFVQVYRL